MRLSCAIGTVAGLGIACISIIVSLNSAPIVYSAVAPALPPNEGTIPPEKLSNMEMTSSEAVISSYDMKVDLQEKFNARCSMVVESNEQELEGLCFKLDECFNVDSIMVNGAVADWERIEDDIQISGVSFNQDGKADISLVYGGHVNYADRILRRNVFVDNTSANLPDVFAWYPKLGSWDVESEYAIELLAHNRVVSNLSQNTVVGRHGTNTIVLRGTASDVYLISGFFSTVSINGMNITCFEGRATPEYLQDRTEQLIASMIEAGSWIRINATAPDQNNSDKHEYKRQFQSAKDIKTVLYLPFSYNWASDKYCQNDTLFFSEYYL